MENAIATGKTTGAGKASGVGRAKGVALIRAVKILRQRRPEALDILDESCHSYLDEERIFPSNWYPEDDLMALLRALVTLLPARPDIWEFIGHDGGTRDFQQIYTAFVRPGHPEFALGRYGNIWRLYHDNGDVRVRCATGRAASS